MHVLLKWAFFTEGVVSGGGLFCEEVVEAAQRAVARDGWVVMPTVSGVVLTLQVATLAADPTAFVGHWVVGACIYVMG
jgi:hypothetical protein